MRLLRLLPALALLAPCIEPAFAQGPPPPPPPLQPPPVPPGNPITPAKVNLGKVLFSDEQMSSNRTVACASCHVVAQGGADPRASATNAASRHPGFDGVSGTADDVIASQGTSHLDANGKYVLDPLFRLEPQVTGRKAPSVLNAAYVPEEFWDGRAPITFRDPLTNNVVIQNGASLESQVLAPPVSAAEMGHDGRDWNQVAAQIAASTPLRLSPAIPPALANWINGRSYPQLFQEAFGTSDVTPVRIALAIATFERTLWTGQAPIDAFFGGQPSALTPQELAGQAVFTGPAGCAICHAGNQFTNHSFRYIGVRPQDEDLGRFLFTGVPGDRGRMKVPSLRNVELRAPYFHNGEMATLEDVIDFYDRGGDFDAANKDPLIHPLGLTATQKANLAAFLRRPLTDPRVAQALPPFDLPALYASSTRVPTSFGSGTPGASGLVPRMIALEPAYVGNPRMTFAIDRALGGRPAALFLGSGSVPGGVPFFGTSLFVDLTQPFQLIRLPALGGSGAGAGFGSVSVSIPNDPLLVGVPFYAQWLVFDSTPGVRFSSPEPVAATRF